MTSAALKIEAQDDWQQCQTVLSDIIARCKAAERRLTDTDAYTRSVVAQVRKWRVRAERVLSDPKSAPMADYHLMVFAGDNGHAPAIRMALRAAECVA